MGAHGGARAGRGSNYRPTRQAHPAIPLTRLAGESRYPRWGAVVGTRANSYGRWDVGAQMGPGRGSNYRPTRQAHPGHPSNSSCRTPIRYPQWGAGQGAAPGNHPHSSCRTPIRHPRWGACRARLLRTTPIRLAGSRSGTHSGARAGRGSCEPPSFVLPDSDPVPTVGRGPGAAPHATPLRNRPGTHQTLPYIRATPRLPNRLSRRHPRPRRGIVLM